MPEERGEHLTTIQDTMRVRKRSGETEPVDVDKIIRAVARCATGLPTVEPERVATKTINVVSQLRARSTVNTVS